MAFTIVVDGGDDSIAERWNLKLRFLLDDPTCPEALTRFDHPSTFLRTRVTRLDLLLKEHSHFFRETSLGHRGIDILLRKATGNLDCKAIGPDDTL